MGSGLLSALGWLPGHSPSFRRLALSQHLHAPSSSPPGPARLCVLSLKLTWLLPQVMVPFLVCQDQDTFPALVSTVRSNSSLIHSLQPYSFDPIICKLSGDKTGPPLLPTVPLCLHNACSIVEKLKYWLN